MSDETPGFETRRDGKVLVIEVNNPLSQERGQSLAQSVIKALDNGDKRVAFDLSELTEFEMDGIGGLVVACAAAGTRGGQLACAGASKDFLEKMKMIQIGDIPHLEFVGSVAEAIEALK